MRYKAESHTMTSTLEPSYGAGNDIVRALRRSRHGPHAGRCKRLLILGVMLVSGGALVSAFSRELHLLWPQVANVPEVAIQHLTTPESSAIAGLRGTLSDPLPASDTKVALRGTLFSS